MNDWQPCRRCGTPITLIGLTPFDPVRNRPHNRTRCRHATGAPPPEPRVPGKQCRHCKAPVTLRPVGAFVLSFERDTDRRHECPA